MGAQVCLVGAMSAPLGGDRLALDVTVRAGARLRFSSAAATIALPGHTGAAAAYDVRIVVEEGAELRWEPEPLIAAGGSLLRVGTRIEVGAGARLVFREELVLGRAGEEPGSLASRLTVRRDGRLLLDQETGLGPGYGGWDGPAGVDGCRAVGQLLRVGGEMAGGSRVWEGPGEGAQAARMELAGGFATLTSAMASDALALRGLLREG
ncbi:urease accessory protein UreD [Streptomyces polyrhachis]|uniref:urease accessory protein UreD n=1 Tax=Streptomyces polyrhachis TaxID=1282885 RepID=UPI0036DF2E00